jgi:hypothetical protein
VSYDECGGGRREAISDPRIARVVRRPSPDDWSDDELMTLFEAAALFWPEGPLTVTSLRTAVRDEKLAVAEIAGKLLTTKTAIVEMSTCSIRRDEELRESAPAKKRPGSVREMRMNRAQS